jgi:ribonuclease HI
MKFDGASKGNPGPTGFGAVIRDNTGKIRHLKVRSMGHDMNNSSKLWGLIRGIQLASQLNLQPLIIEGESKVIISLEIKIINGMDPEKVTPSWRLLGRLSFLQAFLHPPLNLITSHIRREAKKVAKKLANEGVIAQVEILILNPQDHPDSPLLKQCQELALQHFLPPYGVTPGDGESHGTLTTREVKSPRCQHPLQFIHNA